MPFFLVILVIATFEIACCQKNFYSKNTIVLFFGIIIYGIIGYFFYPSDSVREYLFGIGEKQHGMLFPIALIWMGYLMLFLEQDGWKMIRYVIMMTGCFVASIALIEVIFAYNIFTGGVFRSSGSWGSIRATSTLGNPNYLAGYLLMLLPLFVSQKKGGFFFVSILLICGGILASGSVIGITLMFLYLVFTLLLRIYSYRESSLIMICVAALGISLLLMTFRDTDKWLSLESRGILMIETVRNVGKSPGYIPIGAGPEGVIRMYQGDRSDRINRYFPSTSVIDSSHHILIDIFVKYGVVGVLLFCGYIYLRWGNLGRVSREGIVLFLLFFFLNVPVVSHAIVFVYYIMSTREI